MFLMPDKDVNEVTIFNTDEVDSDKELNILLGESLSSAVIDSGAPETVCGIEWVKDFMNKLSDHEKKQVIKTPSHRSYKFGNSQ